MGLLPEEGMVIKPKKFQCNCIDAYKLEQFVTTGGNCIYFKITWNDIQRGAQRIYLKFIYNNVYQADNVESN